jgi:hypothetical protein
MGISNTMSNIRDYLTFEGGFVQAELEAFDEIQSRAWIDLAIYHLECEGYDGEAAAVKAMRDELSGMKEPSFARNLIDQITNRIVIARSKSSE